MKPFHWKRRTSPHDTFRLQFPVLIPILFSSPILRIVRSPNLGLFPVLFPVLLTVPLRKHRCVATISLHIVYRPFMPANYRLSISERHRPAFFCRRWWIMSMDHGVGFSECGGRELCYLSGLLPLCSTVRQLGLLPVSYRSIALDSRRTTSILKSKTLQIIK